MRAYKNIFPEYSSGSEIFTISAITVSISYLLYQIWYNRKLIAYLFFNKTNESVMYRRPTYQGR